MTDQPPAGAGFTLACFPRPVEIARASEKLPPIPCNRIGDSPGRRIGGYCTTARRPILRANRGLIGRNTSGGTRQQQKWVGDDVPDFDPDNPPSYRPADGANGMDAIAGDQPFIMKSDGVASLFSPGCEGWAIPNALRTGGVIGGKSALPGAASKPDDAIFRRPAERNRAGGECGVSDRCDDVPPDGTLSVRANEPLQQLVERIATGNVCRAVAGTRFGEAN